MSKSYARIVRPLLRRTDPRLPQEADDRLRRAWAGCDAAIVEAVREAKIAA
jgi:hypothetical protein